MRKSALVLMLAPLSGISVARAAGVAPPTVQVPQSQIDVAALDTSERKSYGPARLSLTASTWSPEGFRTNTYIEDATAFHADGVPQIGVSFLVSPFRIGSWALLSPRVGAAYLAMKRTGTLVSTGFSKVEEQSLNFFTFPLGFELVPDAMRYGRLTPFFGLSVVPIVAFTSHSVFEEGTSAFGASVEGSLGVDFECTKALSLDLSLSGTKGRVNAQDVSGVGIQGGLKLSL